MNYIKKILLVPSERTVSRHDQLLDKSALRRFAMLAKEQIKKLRLRYDGEIQFYGDIPAILGQENTFSFGRYNPLVLRKFPREDSPYISIASSPEPSYFSNPHDLPYIIKKVDAVFVSTRAGFRGTCAIEEARKKEIPIAILDYVDHPELYGATPEEVQKKLYLNFVPKKDFDIFFKKRITTRSCK